MEILYTHVGGIDVHKKQITVTARTPDPKRATRWETTRTFRTFHGELLAMASWLVVERDAFARAMHVLTVENENLRKDLAKARSDDVTRIGRR